MKVERGTRAWEACGPVIILAIAVIHLETLLCLIDGAPVNGTSSGEVTGQNTTVNGNDTKPTVDNVTIKPPVDKLAEKFPITRMPLDWPTPYPGFINRLRSHPPTKEVWRRARSTTARTNLDNGNSSRWGDPFILPPLSDTFDDPADLQPTANDEIFKQGRLFDDVDRQQVYMLCPKLNVTGKNCEVSNDHLLICGTDKRTYRNLAVLQCMQKCNINLKVSYFGPCNETKHKERPKLKQYVTTERPKQKPIPPSLMRPLISRMRVKFKRHRHMYDQLSQVYCNDHPAMCPKTFSNYTDNSLFLLPAQPYRDK